MSRVRVSSPAHLFLPQGDALFEWADFGPTPNKNPNIGSRFPSESSDVKWRLPVSRKQSFGAAKKSGWLAKIFFKIGGMTKRPLTNKPSAPPAESNSAAQLNAAALMKLAEVKRPLTREEVAKILAAADDDEWVGVIKYGYYIGARLSNAAKVRWEEIQFEQNSVTYSPVKQRTDREEKTLQVR